MKGKRKQYEIIQGLQELLEKRGKLNYDYGKAIGEWEMPDENYKYRLTGFDKFLRAFLMGILQILAPIVLKLFYGARVTGKENLKEIGKSGAICISNHIDYLDTLFVRQAMGYFRSYHTMAPFNNKKGLGGYIIRHGGMLPVSSNLTAMKHFNEEVGRLLSKGKIINFYPEEALWHSYQKPRPMKNGAFHYAVKFNVPIVPIFCTFERTKRGRIKRLRINILKPVYADGNLCRREQVATMRNKSQEAWDECYTNAYRPNLVTTQTKEVSHEVSMLRVR